MKALRMWRESLPEGRRSYVAAAKLLGVSAPQLYRYETGQRAIAPRRAREIEKITGIPRAVLRPDIFGPELE
jgi:DNA-binding transcriptional regulator YdaS (Cro superfamily)